MKILSRYTSGQTPVTVETANLNEDGVLVLAQSNGLERAELEISPEGAHSLWEYLSSIYQEPEN